MNEKGEGRRGKKGSEGGGVGESGMKREGGERGCLQHVNPLARKTIRGEKPSGHTTCMSQTRIGEKGYAATPPHHPATCLVEESHAAASPNARQPAPEKKALRQRSSTSLQNLQWENKLTRHALDLAPTLLLRCKICARVSLFPEGFFWP